MTGWGRRMTSGLGEFVRMSWGDRRELVTVVALALLCESLIRWRPLPALAHMFSVRLGPPDTEPLEPLDDAAGVGARPSTDDEASHEELARRRCLPSTCATLPANGSRPSIRFFESEWREVTAGGSTPMLGWRSTGGASTSRAVDYLTLPL